MNDIMLRVVGLGPGDAALLSPQAREALEQARTIVGYTAYMDLVPEDLRRGKTCLSTGMTGEIDRCRKALDAAEAGIPTAVVCSGDPGVYALAGLVLEMAEERGLIESLGMEIVPGIPAVCAAAALLGAPLTHDFACVSLSDLLTPWPRILNRLDAALSADFVLALYNPRSRRRVAQLEEALTMAARHRPPDTPVGVVRQAFRPDQSVRVTTLAEVRPDDVDMLSLLLVGNSETRRIGRWMVTPRGYGKKYGLPGGS